MATDTKAELLLASKNRANGVILYTWRLTFPRIILSEVNTHRMLSRNTSSSRAIPSKKMRAAVLNDPFIPVSLGANQKGMQAGAEITGWRRNAILAVLKLGRYPVVFQSWLLDTLGAHKQVSNRILESYSWCTQILSTTDVNNLFKLRNHAAAEPHFHILAHQMQKQVEVTEALFKTMHGRRQSQQPNGVTPDCMQWLEPGEWHLPLIQPNEQMSEREGKMVSAARCARTSYTLLGGKESSIEADIALCEKLFGGGHYSPFEHQAKAILSNKYVGNFRGWSQYRKEMEGEAGGN